MGRSEKPRYPVNDEEGATLIEYGLMLFFIAGVLVALAAQFGQIAQGFYALVPAL